MNMECLDGCCECKSNFYYDGNECRQFCEDNSECHLYDKNRECRDGKCLCNPGKEENSGDKICR